MGKEQIGDDKKTVQDHSQKGSEMTMKEEQTKNELKGGGAELFNSSIRGDEGSGEDKTEMIIKKIRFIELPINNGDGDDDEKTKDESLFVKFDNGLLIKYLLSIMFVLFLILIMVSFINKCRRNQQLLELRNQKKEVQFVKPEIHYNIMITPELVRKLSLASQQPQKQIPEEMVDAKNNESQ